MKTLQERLESAYKKVEDARELNKKSQAAFNLAWGRYNALVEKNVANELANGDDLTLLLNTYPKSKVALTRFMEICRSYDLNFSGGDLLATRQRVIKVSFDKTDTVTNQKQIDGLKLFLPYILPLPTDDKIIRKGNQSLVGCKMFDIMEYTCSRFASYQGVVTPDNNVLLVTHTYGTRTVKDLGDFDKGMQYIIDNHYYSGGEDEEDED